MNSKKLKRGLKDISDIFQSKTQKMTTSPRRNPESMVGAETSYVGLSSFSAGVDVRLIVPQLFSKMNRNNRRNALVSLELLTSKQRAQGPKVTWQRGDSHFVEHATTWNQLQSTIHLGQTSFNGIPQPVTEWDSVCFDVDGRYLSYYHGAMPFIDEWILVINANLAGVIEFYRELKSFSLSSELKSLSIILTHSKDLEQTRVLGQKLSDMALRRLGISVTIVGYASESSGSWGLDWEKGSLDFSNRLVAEATSHVKKNIQQHILSEV